MENQIWATTHYFRENLDFCPRISLMLTLFSSHVQWCNVGKSSRGSSIRSCPGVGAETTRRLHLHGRDWSDGRKCSKFTPRCQFTITQLGARFLLPISTVTAASVELSGNKVLCWYSQLGCSYKPDKHKIYNVTQNDRQNGLFLQTAFSSHNYL